MMFEPEFYELDEALIRQIKAGLDTVDKLSTISNPSKTIAERYCVKDPWRGRTPVSSVIRKRLQELRKHGLIVWNGKRWSFLDCSSPPQNRNDNKDRFSTQD